MFCQNCGNQIKEKQTFCRVCGEQVSDNKIPLQKRDLMKRSISFSLGVMVGLGFIVVTFFLLHALFGGEGFTILLLFIISLFLSGVTNVLLGELKKMKGKAENLSEREVKFLPEQRKQVEEKSYIQASWGVTDTTTENLLLTKKSITGEL